LPYLRKEKKIMEILSNHWVLIVLRLAHIGGGILWAGSAILFLFLLIPTVRVVQDAGQKFMENFGPRFGKMMSIVTTVTIVAGALLYARFFASGFEWIWTTKSGLAFTIGALAGIISYVLGSAYLGKLQARVGALGATMAAANPPKPEQIAQMNQLQRTLMNVYRFDFALLVIAIVTMAIARYL
jgi:uncharacterized membrane protein